MRHFWYLLKQNQVDYFFKSTNRDKSSNRDNPSWNSSSKLSKNLNIMFNKVSE